MVKPNRMRIPKGMKKMYQFHKGELVYCEETKQVYVVVGRGWFFDRVRLRNVSNVDITSIIEMGEIMLSPVPQELLKSNYPYETIAKVILNGIYPNNEKGE